MTGACDVLEKWNKPLVLPCIAGSLCVISLLLIGVTAPEFVHTTRELVGSPLPLVTRIISHIHWEWTLPLGCMIAAVLIWGSRRWSRQTSNQADKIAIALSVLGFIAFCLIAVIQMSGTPETG